MAKKSKLKRSKADKLRYVCLTIVGRDLDPEKVTQTLGIRPDDSCRRGEPFGKNRKTRQAYWSLKGHPSGCRLETQLNNIVKRTEPVRNRLRRILRDQAVEQAYVTIAVEPPEWVVVAAYCFDAEILNKFTSIGIDIALSLYIPGKVEQMAIEVERERAKRKRRSKK